MGKFNFGNTATEYESELLIVLHLIGQRKNENEESHKESHVCKSAGGVLPALTFRWAAWALL